MFLLGVMIDGAYFIDRDPKYFRVVLNYLRCGQLLVDSDITLEAIRCEASYFGLGNLEEELKKMVVVISSTGGAAQRNGGVLGQFEYDEHQGYYQQTSTEQDQQNFLAVYLYPDKDDKWWVNDTPGEKTGYLHNPRPSKTLPTSGWQYWNNSDKSWTYDPTLTISPGPLPPLARQFTVSWSPLEPMPTGAAFERPKYLGVFTRSERWWLGRPVYTNTQGMFLHHGPGDFGWVIGFELGERVLRGSQNHHSPESEDNWSYSLLGWEWKAASVKLIKSE